ncbi:MAG: cytochrome c1 [Pseudomonadales bacterium]|nr:cytochrome c1 [Pseudomonadales bacterium]
MKRLIIVSILLCFPVLATASGGSAELMHSGYDIHDKDSLRKGAKLYIDNCASCHAAKFMRYERIAQDLEMTDEDVMTNLVRFGAKKLSDSIPAAMTPEMGETAFGVAPPDLTLEANYRGADWVYTYLMSFYKDESAPTGYNNHLLPGVAMPWVMAYAQSSKSEEEFATEMRDLTNFMVYMAEPIRPYRETLGKYVLGFLVILLIPTWLLKNDYWKDIH